MKTLTFLILILSYTSKAQQKESFFITAGATINRVENMDFDFTKALGYYGGIGSSRGLNDNVIIDGSLIYMNQRVKMEDIKVNVNSINGAFDVRVFPFTKGFFAITGMQLGLVTSAKAESEAIEGVSTGNFMIAGGVGYSIEKISFTLKYNHVISDTFFHDTMQAGLTYSFLQ